MRIFTYTIIHFDFQLLYFYDDFNVLRVIYPTDIALQFH
jgi:hypothetical protein